MESGSATMGWRVRAEQITLFANRIHQSKAVHPGDIGELTLDTEELLPCANLRKLRSKGSLLRRRQEGKTHLDVCFEGPPDSYRGRDAQFPRQEPQEIEA